MRKIFLLLILFIFTLSNIYAEESIELNNNSIMDYKYILFNKRYYDQSISKADFSWKKYELLKTDIFIDKNDKDSEKIEYLTNTLKKVWKEKANKLINEKFLSIYWIPNHCFWYDYVTENCIFDKNYTFPLNTYITEGYKVYSEKEETIKFYYYPIFPDYYAYYRLDDRKLVWKNFVVTPAKLILFTNSLDIFKPEIFDITEYFSDSVKFWLRGNNKLDIKKEYKLVKTKYWNYMYIPYYVSEIKLVKWENFFEFRYKKFSVSKDDVFFISK